jgi:uncharacterized protein (TIGR02246 family)
MKPHLSILAAGLSLALVPLRGLHGQETSPEITGLQKAAADFVTAYNKKDAAAVAALFAENGEITDLSGADTVMGRAAIKARYEEMFSDKDTPEIAVETESVRLLNPSVAVEDGTFHLTQKGEDETVQSFTYTAVLLKNAAGAWEIGSSRTLEEVTGADGHLAGLAAALKGDWTCQKESLRMDLAFGWDPAGKFFLGEVLTNAPGADPQTTNIRFGWDGARKTVTWWTFDSEGGFSKGDWTPTDAGWTIRSTGTTADGEATSSSGNLTIEGKDSIVWKATNRLVDGGEIPDNELRLVRRAPEPAVIAEPASK